MNRTMRKPIFLTRCRRCRLRPAYAHVQSGQKLYMSLFEVNMVKFSAGQSVHTLTSLHICAGWSERAQVAEVAQVARFLMTHVTLKD